MSQPISVRKGQGDVQLSREEFTRRFRQRFHDPAFDAVHDELERVLEVAWENYRQHRKAPRTRKAGPGFADPDYDLSVDWIETRDRDFLRRHLIPEDRTLWAVERLPEFVSTREALIERHLLERSGIGAIRPFADTASPA